MLTIVVDNRVRLSTKGLPDELVDELTDAFAHTNPQHAKLRNMNLPHWGEKPIIRTYKREAGGVISFPRGGMSRVRELLKLHGVLYRVDDRRITGTGSRAMPDHNLKLYDYQGRMIDAIVDRENCLVNAPTGSGKTSVAMALIARLKLPAIVIVNSAALFQQWSDRCGREMGMRPGIIRSTKCDLRPITLAMQKTIAVRGVDPDVRDYFGVVIADEVQMFAAKTFQAAIDPFPAKYRVGFSADYTRKDRKEFLIHDLFGEVAADVKREDLIASGHVLDVEIRVVPTNFTAPWYGFGQTGDAREDLNFDRLLNEMAANDDRNQIILDAVSHELADGEQVLVMSHRRDHCLRLAQMISARFGGGCGTLIGGADYAPQFDLTRNDIMSGAVRVAVGTYQAVGQGIDLPRVGAVVAATPIAGNRQFFGQVRGRVCRTAEGKTGARLWYPLDSLVYPKHLANLRKWNSKVVVMGA
jgi:superfamily II DNA or RNA helicase